jgi:hypothetical protein
LIRCPSSDNAAGSTVSEASIAISTAAMPPIAMPPRNGCGKISRLDSASTMVSPDTTTVRPAVATVIRIAADTSRPLSSSSRNRLTTNSE